MQDALKREKEALEASEKQREAIEVLEQKLKAAEEEKKGLVDETSRLKIESAQWEEALDRLQVSTIFSQLESYCDVFKEWASGMYDISQALTDLQTFLY